MADDQMGQDEIEELLRKAQAGDVAPGGSSAEKQSEDLEALDQSEIEALFQSSGNSEKSQPAKAKPQPTAATATQQPPPPEAPQEQSDIEFLLNQAEAALASLDSPSQNVPAGIAPFQLRDFGGSPPSSEKATIDLVRDVELEVKIELGQAEMHLEEVLQMKKGSVVPLDKLAGDPVDVFVNGRLIARGEVLILNDNFCVRITELIVGDAVV